MILLSRITLRIDVMNYTSSAILLIRTWALWNRDKRIAIILGVISAGAATCMIVVCILWQKTIICGYHSRISSVFIVQRTITVPLNEIRNSR